MIRHPYEKDNNQIKDNYENESRSSKEVETREVIR